MFQYAYYKWLCTKGFNVYLDTHYFVPFKREKHEVYKLHYFSLTDLRFVDLSEDGYRKILSIWEKYSGIKLWLRLNKAYLIRALWRITLYKVCSQYFQNVFPKYYRETSKNKDIPFTEITKKDKMILGGYFQSYKYLAKIRPILLRDFNFSKNNLLKNIYVKKLLNDILRTNSVSIHIRRGDYLKEKLELSLQYYINAVKYLKVRFKNLKFFVFGDDLSYIKDNFTFLDNYSIVDTSKEKYSEYCDLFLMSQAKYNIIANSSFSWWGAWLNQNPKKLVLTPERWEVTNTDRICPSKWIRIPN